MEKKKPQTDEALQFIWKTLKNCKRIVRHEIRKECRDEAIKILELADENERQEFIKYHLEDKGNICCLHLDYLKGKLVKEGKVEQKPDDYFHDPFIFLNEINNKK